MRIYLECQPNLLNELVSFELGGVAWAEFERFDPGQADVVIVSIPEGQSDAKVPPVAHSAAHAILIDQDNNVLRIRQRDAIGERVVAGTLSSLVGAVEAIAATAERRRPGRLRAIG
jgi:hypothetical protein